MWAALPALPASPLPPPTPPTHAGADGGDDLGASTRLDLVLGRGLGHLLHGHIQKDVGLGLVLPAQCGKAVVVGRAAVRAGGCLAAARCMAAGWAVKRLRSWPE